MPWIASKHTVYPVRGGHAEGQYEAQTFINLDAVRRVGKTQNGWARIYWTTRTDPLTLSETYDAFIARLRNIVVGSDWSDE